VSTIDSFSFPISVNFTFPVSSAPFGFTVDTKQNYENNSLISYGQELAAFNSVTNSVHATDVSPAASSQSYTAFDSDGTFYNCEIASKNNTLTKVSHGCSQNHDQH
jgi:hypothetical protein